MAGDDRLTAREAADRAKVAPQTIRRWLRSQRLKGERAEGRRQGWRVSATELDRFLESGPALGPEPRAPQGGTMTGYERSREG